MIGFSFLCPYTGVHVHAWSKGEDLEADQFCETVTCAACQRVHFVNSKTGNVVGQDHEE